MFDIWKYIGTFFGNIEPILELLMNPSSYFVYAAESVGVFFKEMSINTFLRSNFHLRFFIEEG